jgi:hypothetical protein
LILERRWYPAPHRCGVFWVDSSGRGYDGDDDDNDEDEEGHDDEAAGKSSSTHPEELQLRPAFSYEEVRGA